MKYLILFLIIFIIIYLLYFLFVVYPQIKLVNYTSKKKKYKKKPKNRKLTGDFLIFTSYYGVDYSKIGLLRMYKILNIVNSFIIALVVTIVFPLKQIWLKLVILALIILPIIWVVYYFLAKYFYYLERKSENV